MDARVVTEFQHVEVAPLRAASNAVNARDVGAFALYRKQGSNHVLVAVMLKLRAACQEPHQPHQEDSEPGKGAPLLHGVVVQRRRGQEDGRKHTLSDVCTRPRTTHTALLHA